MSDQNPSGDELFHKLNSETAQKAHIFLPTTTLYESGGVYINQEARVQVAPPATASASIETDGELTGATTASPSDRASGSAVAATNALRASARRALL